MSDGHDNNGADPCVTGLGPPPTLGDGDITNNYWMESGVCMLDTMTREQVIYVIERNPIARKDLARVTTCQEILDLLTLVPLLPTQQEDDKVMKQLSGDSLPFYTLYRGNLNNM